MRDRASVEIFHHHDKRFAGNGSGGCSGHAPGRFPGATARVTPEAHGSVARMNAHTDFALDQALLRRRFERAAATCDQASVLVREIGRRMDERLDYVRIEPRRIVDLGCGTGDDLGRLGRRYPHAQRVGVDWAKPMLDRVPAESGILSRLIRRSAPHRLLACADVAALPLAHASASLVWSNLMLNWLSDPSPVFREIHRVLEVGGLLMFSTLGPDTLKELRSALPDRRGDRVHRFIDMHDLGDALVQAGFSDPVMDMEVVTLTYTDIGDLLRDLRMAGANNASLTRPRGLSGRNEWRTARQCLEATRENGRIPITFEVVQGHAWKAPLRTIADGRAVIRFEKRT